MNINGVLPFFESQEFLNEKRRLEKLDWNGFEFLGAENTINFIFASNT